MNEEYLKGLHGHLGIIEDYDTWVSKVKDNDEYLRGLHGHLGIKDDYDTWRQAVWVGETPEEPKGVEAEVSGESASTSASMTSSSDSSESNQKQLPPLTQVTFPELYAEYRELEKTVAGMPMMYQGHEKTRMEELEAIFDSQPQKISNKAVADREIAKLNQMEDELTAKYAGMGFEGQELQDVLETSGTYTEIQNARDKANASKAEDEAVLTEITKDTNSDKGSFFSDLGRVFGINAGADQTADEVIDLDAAVAEQLLVNLSDDKRTKEQTAQGYLPLNKKEELINTAKSQVLRTEFNKLKAEVQTLAADTTIEDSDKEVQAQNIQDRYNQLLLAYGVDQATGMLQNNFQKTTKSQEFDEMTGGGGWFMDTADAVSTFLEGVVQTGFKGTVGFTANLMSGLGDITTDDDEYSVFDAFSDTVNQLGNYNFAPSSQKVETKIVDEDGNFNITYKSVIKTIAQMLPFTLAIVNDAKKGNVTNLEKTFGQLLNPRKSKAVTQKLAMVDSAYRHTLSDNLAMAEDLGLGNVDSQVFANTLAMAEGVAQLVMPDTNFFQSNLGRGLVEGFTGNLKTAATKEARSMTVKNFVKNVVLELGEEEIVLATEDLLKYSMVVGHENSEFWNVRRQKELAAATVLLSGALGGVNVKRDYQGNLMQVYTQVANNINATVDALQDELDNGLHNDETLQTIAETIEWANKMNKAVMTSPASVNSEQIDLLIEKQDIITEMGQVDDAFKPQYKERIDAINAKINPKLNEEESTTDGTGKTQDAAETTNETAETETVQTESQKEVVEETEILSEENGEIESSNNKKGVLNNKTYTTNQGEVFNIEIYDAQHGKVENITDRRREDRLSLTVKDANGNSVGNLGLWKKADGTWFANIVDVVEEHRRKGIATAMFDYAESNGFNTVDSEIQTEDGKAFKKNRNQNKETVEDGTESQKKSRKLADTFRKSKFYKNPSEAMGKLQSDPTGLLKFAWDGAMETIATSIEATGNLTAAINKGLKVLKQSQWYQNLSKKGKTQAVELFQKETRAAFEPMAKARVKPSRKSTKTKVREATGQKDTSKKVVTTERKLLRDYFKTMEKASKMGEREGKSAIRQAKKEAIKKLNDAVRPLIKKHKDNTLYAKAYSRAISAINQYEGKNAAQKEKLNNAIAKIEEIIEKEALSKSVKKNRAAAKEAVKRLGRSADPIRRILRFKPEWLSVEDVKALDEVLEMFSTKWAKGYDYSKVAALENRLMENYLERIGERVEADKADEGDNFSEKDAIAGHMAKLPKAANNSNLTQPERNIIRDFLRIRPEYFDGLSGEKLSELNKALTALVEDGIMVNNILFDHTSRFDAQSSSNELKSKLGDNVLKTQNNFIDSVKQVFRGRKGETSDEVVRKVSKRMLQHVDTVIKNFRGSYLYKNIIHPFSSNIEKASSKTRKTAVMLDLMLKKAKTSREGSRIKRMKSEIKRGAKIGKAVATSYEYRMNVILQLYFREKEFRANPVYKNKKVFSVKDHIDAMNKAPQATGMTEASIEAVNKIYDEFKGEDGNIDLDKMDKYFTLQERMLKDFMEETILKLEDNNRFVADHVRNDSQDYLQSYFPRKSTQVDTNDNVMAMMDSGGGLSVKSSAANARKATKGQALNFDTFGTFIEYVGSSNLDFHLSPELKRMRLINAEMQKGTKDQATLGDVLLKVTNKMVEAQVKNFNSPVNSQTEKFFNILKRKTFNKVLIDPIKLIGWDIPSTWVPIALSNAYRAGKVAKARKALPKKFRNRLMDELGSVQIERVGSRSADIKATSASSISKAKYKKADPRRRENAMDFINKNTLSDLADLASTKYYQLVDFMMGDLWATELYDKFQKLTGKELNEKNYDEYRNEYSEELREAAATADKAMSNLFNTATTAEQKLDVQLSDSSGWKKIVDTFMKSFAFNENSVMWDSLRSMVGKGNMSREEAIRTFAIVNARGVAYAYLAQMAMGLFMSPDMPDDEVEKLSEKAIERSIWQHGMLYAFGNRGNLFNMMAAFLIEGGRRIYFASEGEKYNQYEDAVLYAPLSRGKLSNFAGMLGAEGEVIKVTVEVAELAIKMGEKLASGEELTEEDLVDMKVAGLTLNILSQLTGLSTYRFGKVVQKELEKQYN